MHWCFSILFYFFLKAGHHPLIESMIHWWDMTYGLKTVLSWEIILPLVSFTLHFFSVTFFGINFGHKFYLILQSFVSTPWWLCQSLCLRRLASSYKGFSHTSCYKNNASLYPHTFKIFPQAKTSFNKRPSTQILIWMLFLKANVFDHIISNSKWEMSAEKIKNLYK